MVRHIAQTILFPNILTKSNQLTRRAMDIASLLFARTIIIVAISAAALEPVESRAQTNDLVQFQKFVASSFYNDLVNRAIAALPKAVFQRCPSLVSNGSKVAVLKPISFGKDGFPNNGEWKQSFPISGCGNDTTLNFYFSANAKEKIDTIVGLPGTTHTDTILGRDAVSYANLGANLVVKDCRAFDVKNTRFEAYGTAKPPMPDPGPGHPHRPWWETWTLTGCGRTVDVPIDFVPDETGTRIIQPGGATER